MHNESSSLYKIFITTTLFYDYFWMAYSLKLLDVMGDEGLSHTIEWLTQWLLVSGAVVSTNLGI